MVRKSALPLLLLVSGLFGLMQPGAAANYYTADGKIHGPDGNEIVLRGVNYAGFQQGAMNPTAPGWAGPYNVPQYLWEMNWRQQLYELRNLGFNALRIPVSPDTLYQQRTVDQYNASLVLQNPDLIGKRPIDVLDMVLAECETLGLYVLLDMHQTSGVERNPAPYVLDPRYAATNVYDGQVYTVDDWLRDLRILATRYQANPYMLGVDVFNEPHWHLRWDRGDRNFDSQARAEPEKYGYWKDLVERAANAIHAANPGILIFVEGMDSNYDVPRLRQDVWIGWAESFARLAYEEIDRGHARYMDWPRDKIVLSPHSYGPDVLAYGNLFPPKFERYRGFPGNLAAEWDILYGRLATRYAIVPGEFGGKFGAGPTGQKDVEWHDAFVSYLHSRGIRSGFYWNFRNSADTVDVVDRDYNVVSTTLMATLRRLWDGSSGPGASPAPHAIPTIPPPAVPPVAQGVPILFDARSDRRSSSPLAGQLLDRPTSGWIYVRTALPVVRAKFYLNGTPWNVDTRADIAGVYDFNSSDTDFSFYGFAMGTNTISARLFDASGNIIGQGSAQFTVGPKPPEAVPSTPTGDVPILFDSRAVHQADLMMAGQTRDRPTSGWIYVRTALPAARAEFFLNGILKNVDARADIAGVYDFNSSDTDFSFYGFAMGTNTISARLYDASGRLIGHGSATFTIGPLRRGTN